MTNKEEIKSIIIKSLETADNYDFAFVYNHMVVCTNCPYSDDCGVERNCFDYIRDKLEADNE